MKPRKTESSSVVRRARDLPLSSPAVIGLLQVVLDREKPFRFQARGASMSPFLKDGDVITVSPLSGDPRLGDVVAYVSAETGKLAVHRIVGRTDSHYLIAGDGASGEQDRSRRAEILGLITRIERRGKNIRLGLGLERRLIAVATRHRLIRKTARYLWHLLRPFQSRLGNPA